MFQRGLVTNTVTASLGSRVIDFVEGSAVRPTIAGGKPNRYPEAHEMSGFLLCLGMIGTYGANPTFTMDSVKIANLSASVDGGAPQVLLFYKESGVFQTPLETRWNYVSGGDATSNPRELDLLLFSGLLPSHQSTCPLGPSRRVTSQLGANFT